MFSLWETLVAAHKLFYMEVYKHEAKQYVILFRFSAGLKRARRMLQHQKNDRNYNIFSISKSRI